MDKWDQYRCWILENWTWIYSVQLEESEITKVKKVILKLKLNRFLPKAQRWHTLRAMLIHLRIPVHTGRILKPYNGLKQPTECIKSRVQWRTETSRKRFSFQIFVWPCLQPPAKAHTCSRMSPISSIWPSNSIQIRHRRTLYVEPAIIILNLKFPIQIKSKLASNYNWMGGVIKRWTVIELSINWICQIFRLHHHGNGKIYVVSHHKRNQKSRPR